MSAPVVHTMEVHCTGGPACSLCELSRLRAEVAHLHDLLERVDGEAFKRAEKAEAALESLRDSIIQGVKWYTPSGSEWMEDVVKERDEARALLERIRAGRTFLGVLVEQDVDAFLASSAQRDEARRCTCKPDQFDEWNGTHFDDCLARPPSPPAPRVEGPFDCAWCAMGGCKVHGAAPEPAPPSCSSECTPENCDVMRQPPAPFDARPERAMFNDTKLAPLAPPASKWLPETEPRPGECKCGYYSPDEQGLHECYYE